MSNNQRNSLFGERVVKPNDILIWGVGGAGTNIVSALGEISDREAMANSRNVYIDTSRSNLSSDIADENVFIVTRDGKELDGSGGVRATNVDPIAAEMRNAIRQFKPAKYNIIVGSISGGSGSVILTLLAQELLSAGHKCVFVLIGSSESEIRVINTVRSLGSLEITATATKRPVVAVYVDYKRGTARKVVDNNVIAVIGRLSIFFSGCFHGLDTNDVDNFLDYTRIPSMTSIAPQLCLLSIIDETPAVDTYEHNAISIGSLYLTPDVKVHTKDARYDCVGYGPLPRDLPNLTSMHFILTADAVKDTFDKLKIRADEFSDKVADTVTRQAIADVTSASTRHNLLL